MSTDLILILDAASFAADRHRAQRRKDADASPYINHPLALADMLRIARESSLSAFRPSRSRIAPFLELRRWPFMAGITKP